MVLYPNKLPESERVCSGICNQLISENENDQGLPQWMHVGCRHPDGKQQRGQLLSLVNGRYLPMICFSGDFSLSL